MVYRRTVTHPSTNCAWRRATTAIETNALPLSQTATCSLAQGQADGLVADWSTDHSAMSLFSASHGFIHMLYSQRRAICRLHADWRPFGILFVASWNNSHRALVGRSVDLSISSSNLCCFRSRKLKLKLKSPREIKTK